MSNTILIIEDNKDMRDNTAEILQLANYTVVTAENGKIGVDFARNNKPDLILCDIMMPILDGYGVLRAFENIPELAGIPFVFITAKSEKSDFRKGMDLGADDYLAKPFSGDDLLRIVAARLKKSKCIRETIENNLKGINDFITTTKSFHDINILSEPKNVKSIKEKEMVFMEGDVSNFLYIVVSGKVKTFKTNELGKHYITEIHKEGDFFGYISLFENGKHKESAMAIENSEIARVTKDDFFKLLFSNNELSIKFIKLLSNNYSEAEEKLLKLAYDSARKRVAEALIFVAKKYQDEDNEADDPSFLLLRENISALSGISPESVSRNLTDFKEEGLIEASKGRIKIINLQKLTALKN
ncbi:MAG: response regulator [Bacteroidota bacterium]|nr:response regulator [Bacteroidota bacterium]